MRLITMYRILVVAVPLVLIAAVVVATARAAAMNRKSAPAPNQVLDSLYATVEALTEEMRRGRDELARWADRIEASRVRPAVE